MTTSRSLVASAFAVGLLSITASAFADDRRLSEARRHHQALDFEKCLATLAEPAPPASTEADRADAEVMMGVCHFELGETASAHERFRRGLRADPRVLLPQYSSPKMLEAFNAVRAELRTEKPVEPPSQSAAIVPAVAPRPAEGRSTPTTTVAPEPVPAKPMTKTLALIFGGAAVASTAVGTFGFLRGHGLESDANAALYESDAYAIGERAKSSMLVANVAFVGTVLFAATALVLWLEAKP